MLTFLLRTERRRANKDAAPNAGGWRRLAIRTPPAARVGELSRSVVTGRHLRFLSFRDARAAGGSSGPA
jgi:hypothetical protein